MGDDSTGPPLKRRVPGAAGVGNVPSARRALPDTLIARMQAAVDAAHEAQGESSNGAGPSEDAWTFGLRNGSVDTHYQSDEADALDDLAESYLHADPDLTAGYTDDAEPGIGLPSAGPEPRGWDAFGGGAGNGTSGPATIRPVEPGAGVTQQRAAWWDHAVQSGAGRTTRETRPSKARQRWRPVPAIPPIPAIAPALAPEPTPALEPTPAPEPVSAPEPTPAPGSAPARRVARKPTPPVEPPAPVRRSAQRRRGPAMAGVVALAVVLIAGGVVALALSARGTTSAGPSARAIKEAKEKAAAARLARDLAQAVASAATWVATRVDRTTVVACDPATCEALAQHGFPGGKLTGIGTSASTRPKATLVVDTPTARRQLGTGFARDWAPAVLAGFGRGPDRITVRIISPHGARAYRVALRADRKERQVLGSSLLTSGDIAVTAAARSAMAAGDVDSRLLVVITAMASQHPIDILAFGRTWSGTTIGIPLRTAYFATNVPAAYLSQAEYVQAIIGLLKAQPTIYRPVHITTVHLDGRRALRVEFPAPSPLGLINPNL